MATTYWQSNSQLLGESYLTDLLPMLTTEEGMPVDANNNAIPYFDTANPPQATIGIGVNISLPQNMALVLQMLGAINANQTVAEQQFIVAEFEATVATSTKKTLQDMINIQLRAVTNNPNAAFVLTTGQSGQAEELVNDLINGYTIAASDGNSYAGTLTGHP
jgi:hypothetical protein